MKLGLIDYIDCAHRLPGHSKCGEFHGHTYKIEVTIEGEAKGGMVIDFADLRKTIREVLAEFDHKDLNTIMDYPSVENVSMMIRDRLKERLEFPFTLRVWEGHSKWAEVSG